MCVLDFYYKRNSWENHVLLYIGNYSCASFKLNFTGVLSTTSKLHEYPSRRWRAIYERKTSATHRITCRYVAALYTAGTPYVLEYIRRNANRYARELVRRARTRTHVLTLLRCSSVWCADINAHGSLLHLDVCVYVTRACMWNRPRVLVAVVVYAFTKGRRGEKGEGTEAL